MIASNASTDTTPIISVRGLVNQFGEQVVHGGLDLDVMPGEILGVVGGSGTGKSVLMRSILGLREPDAGEIEVLGTNARSTRPADRQHIERNTGVLFQDGALFSSLTVGENVQVPLKEYYPDLPDSLRYELALLKIKLAGLPADALDKLPSQLSGGMRKRAGLARALALDPPAVGLAEGFALPIYRLRALRAAFGTAGTLARYAVHRSRLHTCARSGVRLAKLVLRSGISTVCGYATSAGAATAGGGRTASFGASGASARACRNLRRFISYSLGVRR